MTTKAPPKNYVAGSFSFKAIDDDIEKFIVYKNNIRCAELDAACAEYSFSPDPYTLFTNKDLKDLAEASEYLLTFFE